MSIVVPGRLTTYSPNSTTVVSCCFLSFLDHEAVKTVFWQLCQARLIRAWHQGVQWHSTINVSLDMTNQQVGFTLKMRLAEPFQSFASSVLRSCDIPDSVTSLLIQFEAPVYGSMEPTFTEYMTPGVILSITYFGWSVSLLIFPISFLNYPTVWTLID